MVFGLLGFRRGALVKRQLIVELDMLAQRYAEVVATLPAASEAAPNLAADPGGVDPLTIADEMSAAVSRLSVVQQKQIGDVLSKLLRTVTQYTTNPAGVLEAGITFQCFVFRHTWR